MSQFDFSEKPATNALELTVSELSGAIKNTIEDSFGHVRLRGEVSGFRGPHSSGHVYFALKDQNARIDAIIWKGVYGRLKFKPEEGLEIIATGRISTFPGKSSYQIIIDSIEPAGIGALMALLEERKRKFEAEGLFAAEHKRQIPFLPQTIGVVTSPTGAVIRDILHRLSDRFPRHVLVWPVRVQGETAAREVAAAIKGFNALEKEAAIPRPDVLIIARGGGSVEDLWAFNEEEIVRAAFESTIPLISAIGHETDWTLLDYVADLRAPTPTGAAEMAVPVRMELIATLHDLERRLKHIWLQKLEHRKKDLRALIRILPTRETLFSNQRQRLDLSSAQLLPALRGNILQAEKNYHILAQRLIRLSPQTQLAVRRQRFCSLVERPEIAVTRNIQQKKLSLSLLSDRLGTARSNLFRLEREKNDRNRQRIAEISARSHHAIHAQLSRKLQQWNSAIQLFESLNYKSVLKRGYALVRDENNQAIRSVTALAANMAVTVELSDGSFSAVTQPSSAFKTSSPSSRAAGKKRSAVSKDESKQQNLFD